MTIIVVKNLIELAPGDVIVDPQGRRHTVVAPVQPVHRDADEFEPADDGFVVHVQYVSEYTGTVIAEAREIFPTGTPESILFHIEEKEAP
jgi:hypothetical protein